MKSIKKIAQECLEAHQSKKKLDDDKLLAEIQTALDSIFAPLRNQTKEQRQEKLKLLAKRMGFRQWEQWDKTTAFLDDAFGITKDRK